MTVAMIEHIDGRLLTMIDDTKRSRIDNAGIDPKTAKIVVGNMIDPAPPDVHSVHIAIIRLNAWQLLNIGIRLYARVLTRYAGGPSQSKNTVCDVKRLA